MQRSILAAHLSRGMAPTIAVGQMAALAILWGCDYTEPICGKPLVIAKNEAAYRALARQSDLLLMEDDVIADNSIWEATIKADGVTYARCRSRNNCDNVYTDHSGQFDFTGNVFTRIPFEILFRLPRPIFQPTDFTYKGPNHSSRPTGKPRDGQPQSGSDIWFWWQVKKLDPRPAIIETGTVVHLKHPLNLKKDHAAPCVIEEW